jgi:hypothetical protein
MEGEGDVSEDVSEVQDIRPHTLKPLTPLH